MKSRKMRLGRGGVVRTVRGQRREHCFGVESWAKEARRGWEDNIKMDLQEVGLRTGSIWLGIWTGGGHL